MIDTSNNKDKIIDILKEIKHFLTKLQSEIKKNNEYKDKYKIEKDFFTLNNKIHDDFIAKYPLLLSDIFINIDEGEYIDTSVLSRLLNTMDELITSYTDDELFLTKIKSIFVDKYTSSIDIFMKSSDTINTNLDKLTIKHYGKWTIMNDYFSNLHTGLLFNNIKLNQKIENLQSVEDEINELDPTIDRKSKLKEINETINTLLSYYQEEAKEEANIDCDKKVIEYIKHIEGSSLNVLSCNHYLKQINLLLEKYKEKYLILNKIRFNAYMSHIQKEIRKKFDEAKKVVGNTVSAVSENVVNATSTFMNRFSKKGGVHKNRKKQIFFKKTLKK